MVVKSWRYSMQQPLRPLRQRLLFALPLSATWFVLPFFTAGRSWTGLLLGIFGASLHAGLWLFGPHAHEAQRSAPAVGEDPPEGPFPIWVEREAR